jgi:sialic acid synthase SpsE/sugar phosphate isomerase/epimerase
MTRWVIAEIGINHDGDVNKAQRLIQSSKDAGCAGIKFQYRNIKNAYAENPKEIGDEIVLTQVERTYLNAAQILRLRDFAHSIGLKAGISFFTVEDLRDFESLDSAFDFYKIPSAELMNKNLISKLLETNKDVLISVGMHTEAEIELAFNSISKYSNWIPMHCVSNYPLADHNATIGYVTYLQKKWNRKVGYSSHDENWENNLIALMLGATVIERHITEDKSAEGLDHSSSSNFEEFMKLCKYAKELELISAGDGPRIPNQGELINKQNLGRSFYATREIQVKEKLSLADFDYKSPQTGLSISDFEQYVGKPFVHGMSTGEVLTKYHVNYNIIQVSEAAMRTSELLKVAVPVRLSDYNSIRRKISVKSYEFHLSYKEVESNLSSFPVEETDRFSVHLPDYINSTTLIDPFSKDYKIKLASRECIAKVISFSERLAAETNFRVPIVMSFAGIGMSREEFYPEINKLLKEFSSLSSPLTLQWLPPFAWYFGGSIRLNIMNSTEDIKWINKFKIPVTLDVSHLFLCQAAFGLRPMDVIESIEKYVVHWHISDAAGLDGEGLPIGAGSPENTEVIRSILEKEGLKVIEVWQAHLNDYAGFKIAINKIHELKGVLL